MRQYELWWAQMPDPIGRRPVLLLSRNPAYEYLTRVVVGEITSTHPKHPRRGQPRTRGGTPAPLGRAPWDNLQLAYFAGYAMWTYLNTPFLFALPGVETEELQPWQENGGAWRRLKVTFPASIATHSAEQTFYLDQQGHLKRHDYISR